jgi:hemerythrin-like metal-binding protein
MAFIEWISALSVGVDEIDDQHKELIGRINQLAIAKEHKRGREVTAAVLAGLQAYIVEHFGLEERYFREFGYADQKSHVAEHEIFKRKVADFAQAYSKDEAALSDEILDFLKSWLTKHISFTDRKYRTLFLAKGLH